MKKGLTPNIRMLCFVMQERSFLAFICLDFEW